MSYANLEILLRQILDNPEEESVRRKNLGVRANALKIIYATKDLVHHRLTCPKPTCRNFRSILGIRSVRKNSYDEFIRFNETSEGQVEL